MQVISCFFTTIMYWLLFHTVSALCQPFNCSTSMNENAIFNVWWLLSSILSYNEKEFYIYMYTPQWMSLLVVVFTYHSRIIRSCDAVTIAGEGMQHSVLAPTAIQKGTCHTRWDTMLYFQKNVLINSSHLTSSKEVLRTFKNTLIVQHFI